jgi:hypothetical protein
LQVVNLRGSSVKKATPAGQHQGQHGQQAQHGQQGLFRHIMDAQLALAPAGGCACVAEAFAGGHA